MVSHWSIVAGIIYMDMGGDVGEETAARWLIEFARTDPQKWTGEVTIGFQKQWLALLGDLWKGVNLPGATTLKGWHKELMDIVGTLEKGQPWAQDSKLWRQIRIDGGQAVVGHRTDPVEKERHLVRIMDAFEAAAKDFRICLRKDCRKLFVRTKRQEYCSETCRGTVGKRKYRQG